MRDLRDILGNLPEPEPTKPPVFTAAPADDGDGFDYSLTRMTFFNRLEPGMVFLSPGRCPGRECGLAATNHRRGKFHECLVIDRADEGPFVAVLYRDEDGVQQSAGPVAGITPIRLKPDPGMFTTIPDSPPTVG